MYRSREIVDIQEKYVFCYGNICTKKMEKIQESAQ